jgi:hypothetical protein
LKHPDLVWEVRADDGRLLSCLLASRPHVHVVVQYVDEIISSVDEFDDLNVAWECVRKLYVNATCAGEVLSHEKAVR